jgi:hypothetical protein
MFQDGFRVRRKAVDGKQDSLDATRRRADMRHHTLNQVSSQ